MIDVPSILLAWSTGVVSGFLVSVPVGPTNITIINEGGKRGFRHALLIGLGSVTMEVIYCSVGFASFSRLFESPTLRAVVELISFVLVLYLGLKYLLAHSIDVHSKSVDLVEHKLHPHTAFMTGFVRVLGNPAVLLFWIALSATFISHGWMNTNWASKGACILGVAIGAMLWFGLLSWTVSVAHRKFSHRALLQMSHISGACLVFVAVVLAFRLVSLLAKYEY